MRAAADDIKAFAIIFFAQVDFFKAACDKACYVCAIFVIES